ncbi:hypothetical protein Q8W71_26795 [Methylobacterium sp. NEAU 140]|uniref:DUF6880 family protein n=1 Tax=Methylobacterium sp. NEAU 140 TaxID=3064945 RepID=UPI0027373A21|nr:DUF6880 family protein [Methylobacterium sp. NEAU 140]MDP4026239.1 hypothetical protein [Methylobacterium sp. NEAU 140]
MFDPIMAGTGAETGAVTPRKSKAGARKAKAPKAKALKPGAPARPKGARRTTPSPETLAALGPDRLIDLILGETARNPAFRKLVTAALTALQGPDAVAAMVDRRLAALESAHGYIDWQKRRAFAADLDATVTVILKELRPLDPDAALARLRRFLGGADAVLNRVDDASGAVQGIYERAGEALVEIAAALPPAEAGGFAASLVPSVAADPFGPLGGLLGDLIPGLADAALATLDAALAEAATSATGGARSGSGLGTDARRARILRLRQAVADRRGDADAFIALGRACGSEPDGAAVARRLLAAGRAAEALDWVRRPAEGGARILTRGDLVAGLDRGGRERERLGLEIEILDALGRGSEAQALRWARFETELDAPMLRAHLAKLPDFEDDEALARALDHVAAFPDPHRALHFLVAWPDLARAARLVRERAGAWRGEHYPVLAPAADALAQDHPVAATLLYRRLLDEILRAGHSGAYAHAARYWLELDALAARLEPGAVMPEPDAYRAALRQAHGRKHAFWGLIRD